MKQILKNPVVIIFSALALIVGISVYVIKTYTVKKTYTGVVIEHNTTSDKYGWIEYYTVAKFNDGYIRSIKGLDSYVVPIGGTVYYTIREFK